MNVTTARRGKEKPMSIFTIDIENNITAYISVAEASATGIPMFTSQATLGQMSTEWPMSRLVEIWNSIPGNRQVTKFADRKKAVARIWGALQPLGRGTEPEGVQAKPSKTTGRDKSVKREKPAKKAKSPKKASDKSERSNKKAIIIAMMKRGKGATLAEIMEVTGWQAHTIRGFVSILGNKGGETIESSKSASGERTYRIPK
jgi:hypothetical protein